MLEQYITPQDKARHNILGDDHHRAGSWRYLDRRVR
jgi:hypothetical protein